MPARPALGTLAALAALALAACAPDAAPGVAALDVPGVAALDVPDVAALDVPLDAPLAGAVLVARRGDDALVAGAQPLGPPGTDLRPARPMAARVGGAWREPPAPVWTGALLDGAVAWVTTDGALLLDDGGAPRELARDVIPELATTADGRTLAFATRPGATAGVYVWDGAAPPRCVTPGLGFADRPLFLDRAHLVVVGAPPGGVAGVWVARTDVPLARPQPVTNATLRTGRPLGPTFVPPPASHASMRVEDGALVYSDGVSLRRVALPQEVLR